MFRCCSLETSHPRLPPQSPKVLFIAALFIIARTWKQPRCPSADEWIRKLWYIYTMDYYSAIKKFLCIYTWSTACWSITSQPLATIKCSKGASQVGTVVKNLPAEAGGARDTNLIPGAERSLRAENGSLFQYSGLGNPLDRGAWQSTGLQSVGPNWGTEHRQ